jgi:hypothetical protein
MKGHKVLSQRHNTVLLEVSVLVVMLNVNIDILAGVEVCVDVLIPEELQLGNDGAPCGHNLLVTQKSSV